MLLGEQPKTGDKNDADDITANAAGHWGSGAFLNRGRKESVSIELTKRGCFLKTGLYLLHHSMLSFVLREERADFVEYRISAIYQNLSLLCPFRWQRISNWQKGSRILFMERYTI